MACPYAGKVPLASCPHNLSGKAMKAIVVEEYGDSKCLKYVSDMPIPKVGDTQVLIKVMTIGVNPVDVLVRKGLLPSPSLPYVPGADSAGYVEQVGSKVTQFKVGEPVYTRMANWNSFAYAQYAVCENYQVFHLPAQLTFSQGCCLGVPYFTAYRTLFHRAKAKSGETILIHGASGGCGTAICQMARAHGLTIVGTAGSEKGMQLVTKCGAHEVYNHKNNDYLAKLQIVGIGDSFKLPSKPLPSEAFTNEIDILLLEALNVSKEESKSIAVHLEDGASKGWLKPVIGSEYPLEEASLAHEELEDHKAGSHGKIILTVT